MEKKKLENVYYLEDFDVDQNGNIIGFSKLNLPSKPIALLVYGDWCGFCRDFKPVYQQFANMMKEKGEPVYVCAIDSDEEIIGKRMPKLLESKNFRGFPHIATYDKDGTWNEYKNDRTIQGLFRSFEDLGAFGGEKVKRSVQGYEKREFDNQAIRIKGQCR